MKDLRKYKQDIVGKKIFHIKKENAISRIVGNEMYSYVYYDYTCRHSISRMIEIDMISFIKWKRKTH